MQCIPDDKYFKYNPDTLVAIRRLYNLDKPGQMDEAIDLLDDWVKKQTHFTRKEFQKRDQFKLLNFLYRFVYSHTSDSREYLERLIILLKGSVERAKWQLDKICTLRTLIPHFFDKYDPKNDLKPLKGYVNLTMLPKLTSDHYRVFMLRYEPNKPNKPNILLHIYFATVMNCEYLKAHDYSNGIIDIVDLRDVNIMDLVAQQINLTEMRQFFSICLEGYDCRIKTMLIISTSKAIDVLVKIFKSMVSEKIGNRIHVLKSVEELHEHVDKRLLPSDYGGEEATLKNLNDKLLDVLSSEENIKYLKEMSKCRTNEAMRTTSKSYDEFLGLTGTFRTLNVD